MLSFFLSCSWQVVTFKYLGEKKAIYLAQCYFYYASSTSNDFFFIFENKLENNNSYVHIFAK